MTNFAKDSASHAVGSRYVNSGLFATPLFSRSGLPRRPNDPEAENQAVQYGLYSSNGDAPLHLYVRRFFSFYRQPRLYAAFPYAQKRDRKKVVEGKRG